jgi:hypothetical protein
MRVPWFVGVSPQYQNFLSRTLPFDSGGRMFEFQVLLRQITFPVCSFAKANQFPVDLFAKANQFPVDLFAKANQFPVDLFAKANK